MENEKKENLNFVFFGTPDVASETLEILKQAGYLPSLIITSPDAQKGRGLEIQASPAALFAESNYIDCFKPEKIEDLEEFLKTYPQADLFIFVAYGKIVPEKVIHAPKLGSINIHYSLLPKYRGASPVESAILNGDIETGVTIQQMALKMDSGLIIAQEKVTISPNEKAPELRKRLIKIGSELLVKTIPELTAGTVNKIQQDENEASYCKKIKKEDGLVNMKEDSPVALYNKFRAYSLWPRIFFFKNNKRVIIIDAILEDNKFVIKKVLPEGKKEIKYEDFTKIQGKTLY